jgi:putative transposase
MPFTRLFYHLIWSTKKRLPLITPEVESNLFAYMQRKAGECECRLLAINGWRDHIHLVLEIPPKLSVAEAVKYLKGASSHEFPDLYWQRGYGALTVSERNLEGALTYVARQKEHHGQQTAISRLERCDDEEGEEIRGVRDEAGAYDIDMGEPF